jgi:hypothetical protein
MAINHFDFVIKMLTEKGAPPRRANSTDRRLAS